LATTPIYSPLKSAIIGIIPAYDRTISGMYCGIYTQVTEKHHK